MRKLILLGVFIPSFVHAQNLHVELFGGFSNYSGDLKEKNFTTQQAKGAVGLGLRYDITNHFSVRTNFTYAALGAADKYNKQADLRARNLSFQTKLTEGNLLFDYNILNLTYHKLSPYVFAGVAVFHYNPYAYDSAGNKIYLKPLSTEGEGLAAYPGRKAYNLTQFALPFGAGVRWRFTDNITLSYEIGFRKTFTDYLDDVSTNYVDQTVLATAKGAKAVEMAWRGGELKNGGAYPADGSIRGGSKFNDWYYFSGVTLSIGLGKRRGFHGSDNGRTDCPKPVQ
jgi:opacity protein-like surface antigen